jgi:hypothetical protein
MAPCLDLNHSLNVEPWTTGTPDPRVSATKAASSTIMRSMWY